MTGRKGLESSTALHGVLGPASRLGATRGSCRMLVIRDIGEINE